MAGESEPSPFAVTQGLETTRSFLAPTLPATESAAAPSPMPARIGRYLLIKELGSGGMGIVYAAYDPILDRKVAVKLLHTNGVDHREIEERLVREAQAIARLSHQNVVGVFDVGAAGDRIFMAMEFVEGQTLRAWLSYAPRSWQQIVHIFIQAGHGLSAAHHAALVHRDFKPDNLLVSEDGRARVCDFGLALNRGKNKDALVDDYTSQQSAITSIHNWARAVMGTPAYMAPEQWLGGEIDVRTDQFSFCVALHEALFGHSPFLGDTIPSLCHAVCNGQRKPIRHRAGVPTWVLEIIDRGLKINPEERFPDMDSLLHLLDGGRSRHQVRLRMTLGIAVTIVVLTGAWLFRRPESLDDRCSGGVLEIAAVWGPNQLNLTEQNLATAGPAFAEEVWPRVSADLGRYADTWTAMHRAACESHQRGENSGALLDRRMACLADRKAALAEAVSILGNADIALHALEVTTQLPPLGRCADIVALEADIPPPADPAVRARVDALRPRLARVAAFDHAGQSLAAITLADDVVRDAETIGERALLAEALLQRGRLEINRVAIPQDQEAILTRAYLTALGGRLDELAAEALALRLSLRGRREGGTAKALEDLDVAREMVARLPPHNRIHGLLLNNAGNVYMATGDVTKAAALFRDALAARESALGPTHVEVAYTLFNLALVTPSGPERMQLVQRSLAILDDRLGQAHPQNIELRLHSSYLALDPRDALALVAPACDTLARFTPDDRPLRARCLAALGHHAAESGDTTRAMAAFSELDAHLASPDIALPAKELAALRGEAALYTNNSAAVLDDLRAVIAPTLDGAEPWQHSERGELELLLGQNLTRLGDPTAAGEALAAAVADYEAVPVGEVLVLQRLAAARLALADHLTAHAPAEAARAATLREQALQWYQGSGPGYAWRLVQTP